MVTTRTKELLKYDAEHVLHSLGFVGRNLGFAPFEEAQGIMIKDTDGKEYIDLASQLVNVNLGHNRKDIAEAMKAQIDKMMYTATLRGYANAPAIEYSQKLAQVVPKGLDHFLFTMTGGDADDCAFKIANRYYQVKGERRYKIISLFNSYHGTLRGTGGATAILKGACAECPPCGHHLHIPNYFCYRCPFHKEYPGCGIECARFLDYVIENEGKDSIACVLVEPEQGAGGFISPPPEYLPMVREICSKHGVLLIADEVMTGFGRTGKMFAVEHWNVTPDIMTMSKAIVSAYLPFGAVAVSDDIWNTLKGQFFAPGSSESGNPICCAVASKVLDVMREEHIVEHAAEVGKHVRERLEREFLPLPHVGSLSGLGLMLGLDYVVDKATKAVPGPEVAAEIQRRGFEQGLYLRVLGNRLCFSPPLVITQQEADEALNRLYPIMAELKLS
jgi:adenosylmethionine-8-amino-7-oxononanoate aminotransferase